MRYQSHSPHHCKFSGVHYRNATSTDSSCVDDMQIVHAVLADNADGPTPQRGDFKRIRIPTWPQPGERSFHSFNVYETCAMHSFIPSAHPLPLGHEACPKTSEEARGDAAVWTRSDLLHHEMIGNLKRKKSKRREKKRTRTLGRQWSQWLGRRHCCG